MRIVMRIAARIAARIMVRIMVRIMAAVTAKATPMVAMAETVKAAGVDDGVEGVGDSAGSAGERAQVLHGDVLAENRPQNTRELVDHPWSLLGCPNLNIRWATRRIWISSAPSVMR